MIEEQSEIIPGSIACAKDILLKDLMVAIYEAGKADGHKEGFNEGYKQRESNEAEETELETFEWGNETYEMEVHQ